MAEDKTTTTNDSKKKADGKEMVVMVAGKTKAGGKVKEIDEFKK